MKSIKLIAVVSAALVCASGSFAGVALPPSVPVFTGSGAPTSGSDEVQTLTFDNNITGGSFRLKFGALTTGNIVWSSNNTTLAANVQMALRGLNTIGVSGVDVSDEDAGEGGHGDFTVTFSGPKTTRLDVPQLSVQTNALIGSTHTLTVATNEPGVTADGRSARSGSLWVDQSEATLYETQDAGPQVNWVKVGQLFESKAISIPVTMHDTDLDGLPLSDLTVTIPAGKAALFTAVIVTTSTSGHSAGLQFTSGDLASPLLIPGYALGGTDFAHTLTFAVANTTADDHDVTFSIGPYTADSGGVTVLTTATRIGYTLF